MNDCKEDRQMARATLAVALASRNDELDIRECFCYDEHREKSTV